MIKEEAERVRNLRKLFLCMCVCGYLCIYTHALIVCM
jgi:hypothetical protein